MKIKIIVFLLSISVYFASGCRNISNQYEETNKIKINKVHGVLQYFPEDVQSVQSWYGHNFIVGTTPVKPSEKFPIEEIKKYIGKKVEITGQWDPGYAWRPIKDDMNCPMPLEPDEDAPIIRNDGLLIYTITLMNNDN